MPARPVVLALAALALALPSGAADAAKHRIGVRVMDGDGQLFDRLTGRRFVPRGANYIRLDRAGHSTFKVGVYDGSRAGRALAQLRKEGYDAVRVFLEASCSTACVGVPGRLAVSRRYMANVVDFLRRARAHGISVVIVGGWLPDAYGRLIRPHPRVENVNLLYLTRDGVDLTARFWRDVVRELLRQRAPLEAILAYDLRNEPYFTDVAPPFSLASGVLRAPNGRSYDLAVASDRDRLMDDGLVYWANRLRAAIRRVDPTALVTASFFEPQGPNPSRPGDDRVLETRGVIERSTLDYVDLHAYPGGLVLPKVMENFGVAGPTRKPLLMGEFGAFKSAFATAADAARGLEEWQAQSCRYGFDGWLLWTWDTDEQPELWNGQSGGGAIGRALSPRSRPDPCEGAAAATNLALARPVTASASIADGPPSFAVDGNTSTPWISGQDAPQWIEIDLGAETAVSRIRLVVSQFPDGLTVHRVLGRGEAGDDRLLAELSGLTRANQTLEHVPETSWTGVRYLRVETVASPSWPSWNEIEVYGAG
jgi:hypothetical protein